MISEEPNPTRMVGLHLTPAERIAAYRAAFPRFPPPYLAYGRIEGLWIMGNCYQTSGYYGAYPHGYLDRVLALFPDAQPDRILHLFSGSLPAGSYSRFDRPGVMPDPRLHDFEGDAHSLGSIVPPGRFDLILADPPYSAEDADHYGAPMISRRAVLAECLKILPPGGWVIWLDQAFPMFRKMEARLALAIGMVKSTNHRVRCIFGFQRAGSDVGAGEEGGSQDA